MYPSHPERAGNVWSRLNKENGFLTTRPAVHGAWQRPTARAGCDRPPLAPPPPSESHLRNLSSTELSMTTAKTWPGKQTTARQLRQPPGPTDPRSPMGPKLPTVTEAARQMWSMVTIRSVALDGRPPGAVVWNDDKVAVEADVVPSNTTESCARLCCRVPLHPLRPWRDEAMSRHWWGCGCVDYGDGFHRRIAGSPLASTFPRPPLLAWPLALLTPNRRLDRASSHSSR
ncbi:hypothetical protein B0T18DRAFT_408705 [Schizothecium vesticola]|uniref:Uncharacterized protein n=1 Tax=Schizothecium vesticola TaxID=314040 RepID=A0AA40F369_9PEZI|nr:hypothetical protein B0T18DRAFT_408705 [Schizothecium vesticola]